MDRRISGLPGLFDIMVATRLYIVMVVLGDSR